MSTVPSTPPAPSSPLPADAAPYVLTTAEILAPVSEPVGLVSRLGFYAGATSIVAGYGFSGKSLAMQSAAVGLAAGSDIWGAFDCRQRRVIHIDDEQGPIVTRRRYQRIVNGYGLTEGDLGGRLRLLGDAAPRLNAADAESYFARLFEGFDLAFIDSFKSMLPGVDENNADIRSHLDMLSRVSAKTGAVVVVIHHARKPQNQNGGGSKAMLRGSSAIFDACDSVFLFSADDERRSITVERTKARSSGTVLAPLELTIEDVCGDDGDPSWGLRVIARDAVKRPSAKPAAERMREDIVAALRSGPLTKNQIDDAVKGQRQAKFRIVDDLRDAAVISLVAEKYQLAVNINENPKE